MCWLLSSALNSKSLTSTKNTMNKDINSLKIRLQELDREILMVEKQLPAHSVKPPIMTQLFELEDERDTIFKELERLKRPDTD